MLRIPKSNVIIASIGALAMAVSIGGCTQTPSPVTPAIVSAPPSPPPIPIPNDADLGTPSGTFTALPDPGIASQGRNGLSGTATIVYNGRRYHALYSGVNMANFASQVSPFQGEIFNLNTIGDAAGVYTLVAQSTDRKEVVAKNDKGVTLRVNALRPITGGFESVTLRLTR